ncbi:MAG: hypothetical protein WCF96_06980 [Eubacteriales bacterium]
MYLESKSRKIMEIAIKVMENKEQLYQLMDNIDLEKLKRGTLSVSQDILNKTFRKEIIDKLGLIDFKAVFSKGSIKLEITKNIKIMFMDVTVKSNLVLTDCYLSFGNNIYGFYANYSINFEGVPQMMEKLPGGVSLKDAIINSLLKNSTKDISWISFVGDTIMVDLNKSDDFRKLKEQGIYGIDVIKEVELKDFRSENERILIDFIWQD